MRSYEEEPRCKEACCGRGWCYPIEKDYEYVTNVHDREQQDKNQLPKEEINRKKQSAQIVSDCSEGRVIVYPV